MKTYQKIFITNLTLLVATSVSLAKNYTKISSCGSARVVSGDTCSSVKVEFNFNGCEYQSEPKIAKKIICEKDTIKARFQADDFRYEASFQKIEDGWNGISWKSTSEVNQYRKEVVSTAVKPTNTSSNARNISSEPNVANNAKPAIASTEVPSPSSASSLKFSGYVDIRHSTYSTKDNPSLSSGHPESGFGIEEAALYGNYEKDKVSLYFDLPVRRNKDIDSNSAATAPNQSSNGNLVFGYDRAQLYLKYQTDIVNWYFGQFDTIFGVELNDSKDRLFSKTGIVYDYTLPVTHTGLMLEYSANGFYVKSFAANPNNKGSYGSSSANDDQTEYGAAIGYSSEYLRGQIGAMSRLIDKASLAERGNRVLYDITLGATIENFNLDVEYSSISDPYKNTLTSNDNSDLEKPGYGVLALLSYKILDDLKLGLRHEIVQNDPGATSIKSIVSNGAAVHYNLTQSLVLRGEYIAYTFKNLSDVEWKDSRLNLSALMNF